MKRNTLFINILFSGYMCCVVNAQPQLEKKNDESSLGKVAKPTAAELRISRKLRLLPQHDLNGDGVLDAREKKHHARSRLLELYDVNNNGRIESWERKAVVKEVKRKKNIKEALKSNPVSQGKGA